MTTLRTIDATIPMGLRENNFRVIRHAAAAAVGIYLYAFPIQQLLVFGLGPHDPLLNVGLTLLLVLPCATGSWFWIEKPALELKPWAINTATRAVEVITVRRMPQRP